MSGFWLAVNLLAVYRLSILASRDKITEPARRWVLMIGYEWHYRKAWSNDTDRYLRLRGGPRGKIGKFLRELIVCPWCVSMWFAACAIVLTETAPAVWKYPALVLALSGFTVLGTRRDND